MSDGIPDFDWRELRKKTLFEIKEHREGRGISLSNKRVEKLKNAPKVHFLKFGHALCGTIKIGGVDWSIDKEAVTCSYCKKLLARHSK